MIIFIPQVAFGAWWKPSDWIKRRDVEQEKADLLERLVELEAKVNKDASKSDVSNSDKEKIIKQTIVVDNPELQKKIDALLQENVFLKNKIESQSSLVQQLNLCKADLSDLKLQEKQAISKDAENSQIDFMAKQLLDQVKSTLDYVTKVKSDRRFWSDVPSEEVSSLKSILANDITKIRGLIYTYDRVDSKHVPFNLENQTSDLNRVLSELQELKKAVEFHIQYK